MKTICVTGGNGLLGNKILMCGNQKYHFISIDLHKNPLIVYPNVEYRQADICEKDLIFDLMVDLQPDCIIHTAAFTDVDGCEKDQAKAWKVNVRGTENIASVCYKLHTKMIHLSTDYVFDGKKGPYRETDSPNPISFYGTTKLESETVVMQYLHDAIIARTMVLYGFVPGVRKNFVTWVIDCLRQEKTIQIVDDQYGTPTLSDDLARMILALYEKNTSGLYHTAGKDLLNRYNFALEIARIFHLDSSKIQRCKSHLFNQLAPRPLRSGLLTEKIHQELGISSLSVHQGLEIIKEQMAQYINHS